MIRIIEYTVEQQDSSFYSIMGKFFAFRKYAHEMGGWQFYNKDNTVWFLMYLEDELIGFCSLFNENTHVYFDNAYIFKEFRGHGYSRQLFDARLTCARNLQKEIRVISDNPRQIHNYIRNGFEFYGKRGRYGKYRLRA